MTEATSTAAGPRLWWAIAWLVVATVLFSVVVTYALPGSRTTVLTLTVGVPYLGATVGAVAARDRRGAALTERIVIAAAWASTAASVAAVGYLIVLFVFLFAVLGGL